MKTPEEVEALKRNWEQDSIWDLEFTDGFEEYHDELLAHRLRMEGVWHQRYWRKVEGFADTFGLRDNLVLAEHLMILEDKIRALQAKLDA